MTPEEVRALSDTELDALIAEKVREAAELARKFHEAYERLAPQFEYETRRESAVPWEDVPEANRNLMVAVAAEIIGSAALAEPEPQGVGREGTGETLTHQESETMARVLGWYGSMRGSHAQFFKDVDDLRVAGRAATAPATHATSETSRQLMREIDQGSKSRIINALADHEAAIVHQERTRWAEREQQLVEALTAAGAALVLAGEEGAASAAYRALERQAHATLNQERPA